MEFEYKRHGTLDLLAARTVYDGKIIVHKLGETHNSIDFLNLVQSVVDYLPQYARSVFILDQYNTHKSEEIVRYVAHKINFTGDLGIKGKRGILKDMKTRQAFLESACHSIRFLFTPKHCSWLNQIETWFGLLQRNLLKDLSCKSKDELKVKIELYIQYFNTNLAKPFIWKFAGYDTKKFYKQSDSNT